jgi:hypothetical protein
MDAAAKTTDAGRRSTRIRAQLPLRVTSLDPALQFSEHCHTLVVNVQGAFGASDSNRFEVLGPHYRATPPLGGTVNKL